MTSDQKTPSSLSLGGARPLPSFVSMLIRRGVFLPLWRITRGMTLGVRAIVLDQENRVLLIRHGYTTGAHFPGGGVDRGETVLQAMHRELDEEARLRVTGSVTLHGVFTNFAALPGDHVFVYVVKGVEQIAEFTPNWEITSCGFYSLDDLPADISGGTSRRLKEIIGENPVSETW